MTVPLITTALLFYTWIGVVHYLAQGLLIVARPSHSVSWNLCNKLNSPRFSFTLCERRSRINDERSDKKDDGEGVLESAMASQRAGLETQNVPNNSGLIAKLKAEASSPFRLFRQYLLAGGAVAGGLGTITTLPQLIRAVSVEDRNTALANIAIDAIALVVGGLLWKYDTDQGKKKIDQFAAIQKKVSSQLSKEEAAQREFLLGRLPVEIQINERNESSTRIVPLSDLFEKGQQCVVIVAGNYDYVRDAIIAARSIGPSLFSDSDAYVVPFVVDEETEKSVVLQQPDNEIDSKGFGVSKNKPKLMSAPYFAKPKQLDVWQRILESEFSLAEAQGSKRVRSQGLAIAMNRNGKVLRRGLGQPPWREVIGSISSRSNKNGIS